MTASSPKILSGKLLGAAYERYISRECEMLKAKTGRAPGLATILVGDNPASHTYVASKERTAKRCGLEAFHTGLPATCSFEELVLVIDKFNRETRVDGILLQLPLPPHLDSNAAISLINPAKDADGLHPLNQGLLMRGQGTLLPCTPLGSMKLIDLALSNQNSESIDVDSLAAADLRGKRAVVIGRSILVGKPVALMLLERNATVIMAHSKTPDLAELCASADILVAAVGVPRLVKGDWVKKGAIVIDVGMNRLPDGKLCGDVDYEAASARASAITPVPGGVGPMTVTMLILNTLEAFRQRTAR